MASLHSSATIRPTKPELLEGVLGGPVEVLGSYRFDDPAGEVGVEAFVVRRGAQLHHVVFTYRSAPLEAGQSRLVGTMEHSVLGPRWVYDGTTDPVAVDCFRRALLGEQNQAVLELWEDGRMVGTRAPTVRLSARAGAPVDGATVRITGGLGDEAPGPALMANWAGGEAVVARLGD
jgi:Maltokinase N-terminal cap domain